MAIRTALIALSTQGAISLGTGGGTIRELVFFAGEAELDPEFQAELDEEIVAVLEAPIEAEVEEETEAEIT